MSIISHGNNTIIENLNLNNSKIVEYLEQFKKFELGKFLINNLGLNRFWTSYILLYPDKGKISGKSSDGTKISEFKIGF